MPPFWCLAKIKSNLLLDSCSALFLGSARVGEGGCRLGQIIIKNNAAQSPPLAASLLLRLPSVDYALAPLPALDAAKKQHGFDDNDAPLPGDTRVLEDVVVDNGHVQDDEHGCETKHDGPEQELVAPDISHPLREVELRLGLHAEERPAEIHQLPGQEQREPRHGHETGRAGSEYGIALGRVGGIAVRTLDAVAPMVADQSERRQTKSGHPETVDSHVHKEFGGEDTALEVLGRSLQNIGGCRLETETHIGESGGDHNDPHDFDLWG